MAQHKYKMKTFLIFIILFSLLVQTEGFNLNKLGRRSGYSRDYQQQFDPNELEEGIRESKLWYLRNTGFGDEEFELVGRGSNILMVSEHIYENNIIAFPIFLSPLSVAA